MRGVEQILKTAVVLTMAMTTIWVVFLALPLSQEPGLVARQTVSGGEQKPDGVNYTLSPSGIYKAALLNWAGGGGISPYCHNRLAIVRADAKLDEAMLKGNAIFEAECDSFSPSNSIIRRSPEVKWEGDHNLKVTFSINGTALYPETFKLRKQDASGLIAVDYEVQR